MRQAFTIVAGDLLSERQKRAIYGLVLHGLMVIHIRPEIHYSVGAFDT